MNGQAASAVPTAPTDQDGETVAAFVAGLAPDPTAVPDIAVVDFAEALELQHDSAIVSEGDSVAAGLEVAEALEAMTRVRRSLDHGDALPAPLPGT